MFDCIIHEHEIDEERFEVLWNLHNPTKVLTRKVSWISKISDILVKFQCKASSPLEYSLDVWKFSRL